jgi:hypothetical protein
MFLTIGGMGWNSAGEYLPHHRNLRQPRVNNQALPCHACALIARQEQRRPGHMYRFQAELQALEVCEFLVFFGVAPQRILPLGNDGAGHQGVDADVVFA